MKSTTTNVLQSVTLLVCGSTFTLHPLTWAITINEELVSMQAVTYKVLFFMTHTYHTAMWQLRLAVTELNPSTKLPYVGPG